MTLLSTPFLSSLLTSPLSHPLLTLLLLLFLSPLLYLSSLLLYDFYLTFHLPPGPPSTPLIGTTHLLPPGKKPWVHFRTLSTQYGGIFTLWTGRTPTLIISDPTHATALLEKRSSKYSSRPRSVAMGELFWDHAAILVQPYGKPWSVRRRLLHQSLSGGSLRGYKSLQEAEGGRVCGALARAYDSDKSDMESDGSDSELDWEKEIDRFTASVVFAIAYGRRIDSLNAGVIRERLKFMHFAASLNVPGKYLVETFPVLKYVPRWMAGWKREMQDMGRMEARSNMGLVEGVRRDLEKKKESEKGVEKEEEGEEGEGKGKEDGDGERSSVFGVSNCMTARLLSLRSSDPAGLGLSDRDFAYIPGSLFGAGSDTTASTLCSGILALLTHPHILALAHAELDAVVGSSRMPTFEDEGDLPYIRSLVKEVLRWRPVAVLGGTPHSSTENDVYQGWFIPKGTTVLGNSWAINLNEEYYARAEEFEPGRWMGGELKGREVPGYLLGDGKEGEGDVVVGKTETKEEGDGEGSTATYRLSREYLQSFVPKKQHPSPSGHSSFGWGRRICPGQGLAENSLFIALARICWGFDILPAEGLRREDYDTGMDAYTDGFNIRPKRFRVRILIRDEGRRKVLVEEEKAAWKVLGGMEVFGE